jgi:hypothetical protein
MMANVVASFSLLPLRSSRMSAGWLPAQSLVARTPWGSVAAVTHDGEGQPATPGKCKGATTFRKMTFGRTELRRKTRSRPECQF